MTNTTLVEHEVLPEWCYDFAVDFKEDCPDCGSLAGEPHNENCDIERCSECFKQRVTCECAGHNPLHSCWTGSWPLRKNFELSRQLAESTKVNVQPGVCYNSSWRLIYYDDVPDATYVEGLLVQRQGIGVVQHGWLECNDEVVDATQPEALAIYIPVLRFKGGYELSKGMNIPKAAATIDLPYFQRFDSEELFRGAWKASVRYVEEAFVRNSVVGSQS